MLISFIASASFCTVSHLYELFCLRQQPQASLKPRTETMKFHCTSSLLLLASSTAVTAFAPLHTSSAVHTRLAATIEDTATSGKLVPPLSPSEICTQDGKVSSLYDTNVQKTYG